MSAKKNRIAMTVVVLFAFMALILGLFFSQYVHQKKSIDPDKIHGTLLNQPRVINDFALKGIDDNPFTKASLSGHWTMMFFGFTHCGSMCPTAMAELSKMYRLLETEGATTPPQVVMISIDPERDDLTTLNHYVHAFNPHFYGARGSKSAIKAMTQEMGIAYAKIALKDSEAAKDYDIEHTGTVLLFNPKGQLVAFFTTPHHASELAKDFTLISTS